MSRQSLALISLGTILAGLVACGGGGGGGGSALPTITVTDNVSSLTATIFQGQGQFSPYVDPTLFVSGSINPMPSGITYAVFVFSGVGFNLADTTFTPMGGNSFQAGFEPDNTLAPSTYTGTITLHLYADSAYTQAYPVVNGSLPFTITVTPQLSVTILDDTASTTLISNLTTQVYEQACTINSRDVVEIDSNLPMTWTGNSTPSLSFAQTSDSTPTAWKATFTLGAIPEASISLNGTSTDGSNQALLVGFNVNP
jgi:hypothetical protein